VSVSSTAPEHHDGLLLVQARISPRVRVARGLKVPGS
jgi:hypothetical protein